MSKTTLQDMVSHVRLPASEKSQSSGRKFLRDPSGILSCGVLVSIALLACLTPLLPLPSPRAVDTSRLLQPPMSGHWIEELKDLQRQPGEDESTWIDREWGRVDGVTAAMLRMRGKIFGSKSLSGILGRDELGRDLASRLFWGARVSLVAAGVAAAVSLLVGVFYGATAGWCGGWVDELLMRIVDVLDSIPLIFLVVFLVTVLGEDSIRLSLDRLGIGRLAVFYLVVGAVSWLSMARIVRGKTIALRGELYIEAARASGALPIRIVARHVIPNLLGTVVVTLSLTVPRVMLFESFLSFLGLGVQPPDVSWGLLANQGFIALVPIEPAWWLFVFPSVALAGTLLALGFCGDAIEYAIDPRRRE